MTMNAEDRQVLKDEAIRNLEGFINTGMDGFRQKALDRLKALGYQPYPFTTKHAAGVILEELQRRD
jgi:hypothetical protein